MKVYNAGSLIMNTYVYPIPEGYVMIDTGYEHCFSRVIKRLKKHGIDCAKIKYVFLTHAHDDHAGFLNELLTKFPDIKAVTNEKALPALLRGQNSFAGGCSGLLAWIFCNMMRLAGKGGHLFPPIEKKHLNRLLFVSPRNIADIENALQGKILFTPGHTSDSMSLKTGNLLFCGDAAMNGFPSRKRITIWIEDQSAFRNSWDLLLSEKAAMLYPAHGRPFQVKDLEKYKNSICKVKLRELKGCAAIE